MSRRTFFVLVCRECDPDLEAPIPFNSPEERAKWATAHTKGTHHAKWWVPDDVVDVVP